MLERRGVLPTVISAIYDGFCPPRLRHPKKSDAVAQPHGNDFGNIAKDFCRDPRRCGYKAIKRLGIENQQCRILSSLDGGMAKLIL